MQKQNSKILIENKNNLEFKLHEANRELATLKNDYEFRSLNYNRNKEYNESLMNQYNDLRQKEAILGKSQRDLDSDVSNIQYLQKELEMAREELRQMEETQQLLLSNDVFKKQKNGDNSWKEVQTKEELITRNEIELKQTKDAIAKHISEQHRLEKDIKEQQKEKDFYSGKIRELKSVGTQQADIDIDKIREKLLAEDVDAASHSQNFFRKFIKDMGYSGEEIDSLDVDGLDDNPVRLDMLPIPDQVKRLEKRRDEMREKKRVLCAQLQKEQDLLKTAVHKNQSDDELVHNDIRMAKEKIEKFKQ